MSDAEKTVVSRELLALPPTRRIELALELLDSVLDEAARESELDIELSRRAVRAPRPG